MFAFRVIPAAAGAAVGLCVAVSAAAQRSPAASGAEPGTSPIAAPLPRLVQRTALDAQWLQLGAGGVQRHASPSMAAALSRELVGGPRAALQLDLGWMRAARVRSTAQGVTAGFSVPMVVPGTASRLTVRPGLAAMAGWAASEDRRAVYDWRGLDSTAYAGQTGTQGTDVVARSRATGVGALVGAEWRVARGVSLSGSVRQWAFGGAAIAPNRHATLAGFGLAMRAPGARHQTVLRPTVPMLRADAAASLSVPPATVPGVSTPVARDVAPRALPVARVLR